MPTNLFSTLPVAEELQIALSNLVLAEAPTTDPNLSFFSGGVWTPTFTPDAVAGTLSVSASGIWTYQRFGPPGSTAPAANDVVRIEGVVDFIVTGNNFDFDLSGLPVPAVVAASGNRGIAVVPSLGAMPAADSYSTTIMSADVIRFYQSTSVTPIVTGSQHIIATYMAAS